MSMSMLSSKRKLSGKWFISTLGIGTTALFTLSAYYGIAPPQHFDELMAGAGAVDITSQLEGAPLGGYGSAPRRELNPKNAALMAAAGAGNCPPSAPGSKTTFFNSSQGSIDAIRAQALVVANGDEKVGIIKIDLIGSSRTLHSDLSKMAETLGIKPGNLAVVGTHTHSGPGGMSDRPMWQLMGTDCYSQSIYQTVLDGAFEALLKAENSLRAAKIGVSSTTVENVTENRRDRPDIVDRELGVMKVEALDGEPIAALFNFAIHGTALNESNMKFSADVMGGMERVVEKGLGKGIAIFTNGSEGDVKPFKSKQEGIDEIGEIVGSKVLELWARIETKTDSIVKAKFIEAKMPQAPSLNFNCPGFGDIGIPLCDIFPGFAAGTPLPVGWVPDELPFQAIRIGDTVFATIPGEPITEIGWDIKKRAKAKGFAHSFIISLANDHAAYFATEDEYNRGKYEGALTLYGPDTGRTVVESAEKAIEGTL